MLERKKKKINPSLESLNEILDFMVKDMESETNLGHPPILLWCVYVTKKIKGKIQHFHLLSSKSYQSIRKNPNLVCIDFFSYTGFSADRTVDLLVPLQLFVNGI